MSTVSATTPIELVEGVYATLARARPPSAASASSRPLT